MTRYYLGIDIGGTYIRMVRLKGLRPHRPAIMKIPSSRGPAILEAKLRKHIAVFLGDTAKNLKGVGVSVAGIVDRQQGVLKRVHNIPSLDGWRVKRFFAYLGVPVRLENDVRCFLLSEMCWGAAKNKKHVVGIAIGTGIGGAIVVNGRMYYGAHGSAGEVGFIVMDAKKRKSFEDVAAREAYQKFGDRSREIGLGVASVMNVLDPEMVLLGGGAVRSKDFHLEVVRKVARSMLIDPLARQTPIVVGKLGDAAQAIGAALLFAKT